MLRCPSLVKIIATASSGAVSLIRSARREDGRQRNTETASEATGRQVVPAAATEARLRRPRDEGAVSLLHLPIESDVVAVNHSFIYPREHCHDDAGRCVSFIHYRGRHMFDRIDCYSHNTTRLPTHTLHAGLCDSR